MVLRAGLDWCGKSRPTGIRSPDRPARRQSLYRLSYTGPHLLFMLCEIYNVSSATLLTLSKHKTNFNIKKFYVLPTQCICMFCVDLRTNSDYFFIQHQFL